MVTDSTPAGTICHVVGARPNFVKAAPVVAALRERGVAQRLIHTGQHYDPALSEVFFTDLGLPQPDVALGVGSGSHAGQTAALLTGLETALADLSPALLVLYGDVNSTLAGALVAAKTGLPVAHVEAGLRSFDPTMPEEINRRVVDALAEVCLVTSPEAIAHLAAEGVPADRIHLVGNPMIDSLLQVRGRLDPDAVRARLSIPPGYAVATLHRPANVDRPEDARTMVDCLRALAERVPTVLPLHPRGRAALAAAGLDEVAGLQVVPPLGYLDFTALLAGARLVLTDSGGVQEETTVLRVPCLTLRPNTERPITIHAGTNRLVHPATLAQAIDAALNEPSYAGDGPPLWDGRAGSRIAEVLVHFLAARSPDSSAARLSGSAQGSSNARK